MIETRLLPLVLIGLMGSTTMPSLASDAYGDPFENWGFVKDDWQVVCDNTLTCRAAGYAPEDAYDNPASIMLVAEPKQAIPKAYLNFYNETNDSETIEGLSNIKGVGSNNTELWMNNKNYGVIREARTLTEFSDSELTPQQTRALLRQAKNSTKIEIRQGRNSWQISDKGMAAVLLKFDDVQGRVGTPLALVSKNNRNRQTPKKTKPVPVIIKDYVYPEEMTEQVDATILSYLQANIDNLVKLSVNTDGASDCDALNGEDSWYDKESSNWRFIAVDSQYTLAQHLCWRGAYNEGYGSWLINNDKPNKPRLITTMANYYESGELSASHKDRGLGDCWNRTVWVWNGHTFQKSEDSSTGLCRGFAGGAWDLPTYVSKVVSKK